MLGKANLIIAQNFGAYGIEIYLACMILYWIMTTLIGKVFLVIEHQLDKGRIIGKNRREKGDFLFSVPAIREFYFTSFRLEEEE